MREFAKGFYNGTAWIRCRDDFINKRIAIDGGLCQRCHDKIGLIVHHLIELTPDNIHDPDISLNHRQLEYVCLDCHNRIHGRFVIADERRAVFDEDGNVIASTGGNPPINF